ncbi:hypothetical protein LGM75_23185 [Burkholderia multivorans]|nr:hypothetical protein [Burkholderia multivorans]MBU9468181.1 hypothetical protein [Burkholderia multivorans]MCA8129258.1 hypothetical protein [Burkholderia multivorans]
MALLPDLPPLAGTDRGFFRDSRAAALELFEMRAVNRQWSPARTDDGA